MTTENKVIIGGTVITILAIIGISFLLTNNSSSTTSIPDEQIVARNGLHWHPKLSIVIKGQKQELTDEIGLGSVHQKMHTHTQDYKDGLVHMEMSGVVTKDETKLKNFFRIWGKEFSSTKIFDKANGSDGKVKMIVNGKENTEFENYEMRDGDKIEISYE
ncbi:MAG: hypothetical protein HY344_00095 [Candidatus Levybacteria bacterium]|nr:hypothetical protein [Candidatus Levybacteria bacterium]